MKKLMVLVAALALVAGSALTAAAADWNFYGSARVATFITDLDEADTTNYEQGLQGNARIGANVKVSDELTGRFEYGTGVNVRILWGEWNFGAGSLGIGQHYTPLNYFYSNQVYGGDNDLLAQGGVYSGRESMIRLKFGGFEVAVLAPKTDNLGAGVTAYSTKELIEAHGLEADAAAFEATHGFALTDTSFTGISVGKALATETSMPGIEANYNLKMDAVSFNLGAGYQTYDILGTPQGDVSVDSYLVALGARGDFGAFYIGGNVYMGQNAGAIIAISLDGDNTWNDGLADYDATTGEVLDNDALGYMVAAGFKASDMFAFEAGYGYAEVETLGGAGDDNEVQSYYVQSTITLAPGVFITPEIGMFDGKETGSEETMYYGAKWQINF